MASSSYSPATLPNTVIVKDETGEVELVLWNDQVNSVKVGDRVLLQDVYVKEFNGNIQLTLGRSGKIIKQ
jgi:replication factor A1